MVMQTADLRNLYHFAKFCILNRPSFWRIPYGEISQASIKCTLLRGFELELRPCFGRFQIERA
jgi:hypothetical protein